jgi:hypothetical protein
MSALVVLAVGVQFVVGSVPSAPELLHWSTVTGALVPDPVIVLVICTVQIMVAPPPLPE